MSDLFELANVGDDLHWIGETQDRITDQLSGTVKGDVPAPIDTMELGTRTRQRLFGDQEVGAIAVPTDRVNRRVLEQQ